MQCDQPFQTPPPPPPPVVDYPSNCEPHKPFLPWFAFLRYFVTVRKRALCKWPLPLWWAWRSRRRETMLGGSVLRCPGGETAAEPALPYGYRVAPPACCTVPESSLYPWFSFICDTLIKKKSLNWWDWTGKTESLIQLRFVGLLLSGKPGAGPKNEVNKINPCPQRTFRSAGRIVGPAKYILYSSVHFWESTEKDSVNSREKARKGPLRRRAEVWPPSETKQKSHEAGIQLCTHPTIC